jgi:hypothetical protein
MFLCLKNELIIRFASYLSLGSSLALMATPAMMPTATPAMVANVSALDLKQPRTEALLGRFSHFFPAIFYESAKNPPQYFFTSLFLK